MKKITRRISACFLAVAALTCSGIARAELKADPEACKRDVARLKDKYRIQKLREKFGFESYEETRDYEERVRLLKSSIGQTVASHFIDLFFYPMINEISDVDVMKAANSGDIEKQNQAFHNLMIRVLGVGAVEQAYTFNEATDQELVGHTLVEGTRALACLGVRSHSSRSRYSGFCVEVTKQDLIDRARAGKPVTRPTTEQLIEKVIKTLEKPESWVDERDFIAKHLAKLGLYCPEHTPVASASEQDLQGAPEKFAGKGEAGPKSVPAAHLKKAI